MTARRLCLRLEKLKAIIREIGPCVVAFSGGVDSTFLARVCRDTLGDGVIAVTMVTPFFPAREKQDARRFARAMGIRHVFLTQGLPARVRSNPVDRCYHCKKQVFLSLRRFAASRGLGAVVEASNADDRADYRPGARAVKEFGIRSPLQEAGLTKNEIRRLSRRLGLESWEKPALACLGSRFIYGEKLTAKKLAMVERAEEYLRALGARQVRVRFHGGMARIEASPRQFALLARERAGITKRLRALGFTYVAVDLEGYRTGAMNETIGMKGGTRG